MLRITIFLKNLGYHGGPELLLKAARSPDAAPDRRQIPSPPNALNTLTFMEDPNLIVICAVAFAAVLILLSALAALIHLITFAFPEKTDETDQAVLAAIHTAVSTAIPGAKVTHIEEIK